MTPQELINFRNEQNQSDTELEFLAFILHGLRQAQHEANELQSQDIAQDARRMEEAKDGMMKAEEQGEIQSSLLSAILDEIHKKDIDLSGVIAGLESVRAEIEASRQEDKEEEPVEAERHERIISVISELLNATRENKPEAIDLSPVVEKTEEVSKKTHKLLSSLIAEIGKIDVRPEVKIDIPKEVEVKEPKWYKPFSFDTKWLKPIEYAINAINPKPALARLEELVGKILKRPLPKVPLNRDGSRVLVEVDRTGGGGSGLINKIGDPINPATEEKQDTIVTALGESSITATSVDASSSGDNTIVSITNTPKLYYVCLSANGANSADVTAIVKIGATTKYKVSLKAGAIWARNIGAEKRYVSGSVGGDIIVNLSAAETVHVSVEYADAA